MMTKQLLAEMDRAYRDYIPSRLDSPKAKQQLLTTCGQEAAFVHRFQVIDRNKPHLKGPARGLLQFERGGGVKGVMTHKASAALARAACVAAGVPFTQMDVWKALETDDALAFAFGRLLLLTDPKPLPETTDVQGGWNMYLWNWRPGAYANGSPAERNELRAKWGRYHAQARAILAGG